MAATRTAVPTFDVLGAKPPADVDAKKVATEWFSKFTHAMEQNNAAAAPDLLVDHSFWRDTLALTWNFRTFEKRHNIQKFLADVLPGLGFSNGKLREDYVMFDQPFPDIAWVLGLFTFETKVGLGSGVFRLVYTGEGGWKAHTVYTNLEDLKGFPELVGSLRNQLPNHGTWPDQRRRELDFTDAEPAVVIIGGGQAGLMTAARLKYMGISALVVDKQGRVGDQWRTRYDSLCLHDPVWYDHMPYLPFPSTWPVYCPAPKIADWLESYAHSLELNIWTGVMVHSVTKNTTGKGWAVSLTRSDGEKRSFKPRHIVWAIGFNGGVPNIPTFPGQEDFQGNILHSTQFKTAKDNVGKKVVLIGACTSAHDIAYDHVVHGVDVTMFQRSSTYIMSTEYGVPAFISSTYNETGLPTDIADRVAQSFPNNFARHFLPRVAKIVADADRPLLDGLHKVGFRTNMGLDNDGPLQLVWRRGGGYYLDTGASQMIVDGRIKLKSDSQISTFTNTGIKFEDGSEIPADIIILCTGFGNFRDPIRKICGDEIADAMSDTWGLNDEGEINGAWRDCGVPDMYYMTGNLALGRYFSKHIALQIKAVEEGVMGERYRL